MVKTFYYYYFLFYKNVFKDGDPTLTARLALTASEVLLLISLTRIFSALFFCYDLSKYYMYGIAIVMLLVNTIIFLSKKKTEEIIQSKPKFFNNHNLTIILSWLFFLVTTSSMFWLGDVVQNIIDNCQK